MTFNEWVESDDGKKHATEYFAERLRETGAVIGSWDDPLAFAEQEQSTWPLDRFGYPTDDRAKRFGSSAWGVRSGVEHYWSRYRLCWDTWFTKTHFAEFLDSDEGRRLVSRRIADLLLQSETKFEYGWDLDKFAVANPTHFRRVGFPYKDDNGKECFRQTFILADTETTGNVWHRYESWVRARSPKDSLNLCQITDMVGFKRRW